MISAHGIRFSYGQREVLDSVDLDAPHGQVLGLVGPNGIGKSTLMRVLAGLERPDAGAVRRAPASLRVGFLPQDAGGNRASVQLCCFPMLFAAVQGSVGSASARDVFMPNAWACSPTRASRKATRPKRVAS